MSSSPSVLISFALISYANALGMCVENELTYHKNRPASTSSTEHHKNRPASTSSTEHHKNRPASI